jgi:magnesium transporter
MTIDHQIHLATSSEIEYFYYDKPGSAPGTLNIEHDVPPKMVLIDYNESTALQVELPTPEDCIPYLDSESVSWIDVQGLGNEDIWRRLGEIFELHPLVLEDVVNVPQRPKLESYEDQLLLVVHMVTLKPDRKGFLLEQVSFILEKNYLLTVQEEAQYDCFEPVRDRIRYKKGHIRKMGADYLIYALLDAVIDGFFPVLETYGDQIEALENEVMEKPTRKTLAKIHRLRRELLALRRSIWPQRNMLTTLIRDENPLINREVQVYLRDCYDHAIQALDLIETYRELTTSLMDVYLSSVSNRMNEVMKTLTVISTIFIPLTFIAGIYGMNFNPNASPWNMPELNWYLGYPLVWLLMIVIVLALIYFFWHRGWFTDFATPQERSGKRRYWPKFKL